MYIRKAEARAAEMEAAVADYLAERLGNPSITRLRPVAGAGAGDIANVYTPDGKLVAIEVKNEATPRLSDYLAEVRRERQAYAASVGVVVHKRRGFGYRTAQDVGNQYVTMSLEDFARLLK